MTREEAINRLQDAKDGYKEYLTDEAIDMAMQALSQMSEIEENIIKYMKKYPNHVGNTDFWEGFYACRNVVLQLDDEENEFFNFDAPMVKKSMEQDAVSRQAVLDLIADYDLSMGQVVKGIHALPPVNPQPSEHFIDGVHAMGYREGYKDAQKQKSGKWIEEVNDFGEIAKYHCSKCYEDTGFTTDCKWKFCPNCGAKMESEEQTDET